MVELDLDIVFLKHWSKKYDLLHKCEHFIAVFVKAHPF